MVDVYKRQDIQTVYDLDKTGIWGEAVRQGKPIILNDFQKEHALKKGYPEGHAPLNKFMTIPISVSYTHLDVYKRQNWNNGGYN